MKTKRPSLLTCTFIVIVAILLAGLIVTAREYYSLSTAGVSTSVISTTEDTSGSTSGSSGTATNDESTSADTATEATTDNIVRYASLTMEVDDILVTVEDIRTSAEAAGGLIESSNLYSGDGIYYYYTDTTTLYDSTTEDAATSGSAETNAAELTGGYLTVRVRDADLETFLESVRGNGTVTAEDLSSSDVTTQYTDIKARISVLEAEVETLTAMLGKATTIEDELAIRDRLFTATADLESYRATLTSLESQDAMAAVSISLMVPVEKQSASTVDIPGFSWYELQQAFATGMEALTNVLYSLVTVIVATSPFWIPILIIIIVFAVRHRRGKGEDATGGETAGTDASTHL